jgi:hypothetical protein
VVGAASLTRSGAERRDRSTTVAVLAEAQNGTSGGLAERRHAARRATWSTPRTGVPVTPVSGAFTQPEVKGA